MNYQKHVAVFQFDIMSYYQGIIHEENTDTKLI